MATCKTCGAEIEVPEGWSVGPAVRRHYWEAHRDRMVRTKADRAADAGLPDVRQPPASPTLRGDGKRDGGDG